MGKFATEGSRRAHRAASEAGAEATRGKPLPPEQVERRRRTARELDLGRHLDAARAKLRAGRGWTPEQEALLGTAPDEELAAAWGRTPRAVRARRNGKRIPTFRDRRRRSEEAGG